MAVLLAVLTLALSRHSEQGLASATAQTSESLEPGTILLLHDRKFWLLNQDDFSVQLYFDPDLPSNTEIGDSQIAPGGRFIYFNVHFDPGVTESDAKTPDQLIQFDTTTRASRVLLERTWLSRLTPISPDGKRAILTYSKQPDWQEKISYCLLDTETGDCPEITLVFGQNELYWIDNDTFITLVLGRPPTSAALIYTLEGKASFERRTLEVNSWESWHAAITPDRQHLVVSGYHLTDNDYVPGLILVDLNTLEVSDLPYKVRDRNIATGVSRIAISPNGMHLTIQRSMPLDVVDLRTGEPVLSIDDALRFVWSSDSRSLLVVREGPGIYVEELVRVDVATGEVSKAILFRPGELSRPIRGSVEVYPLVVP